MLQKMVTVTAKFVPLKTITIMLNYFTFFKLHNNLSDKRPQYEMH